MRADVGARRRHGPTRVAASCATALLASLLAAGVHAAPPDHPSRFADPASGQQLVFQKGCSYCHGIAEPGGRQGPDLLRTARGKGAAELLADMWNHVPQMVGALLAGERLPLLSAGELRDVVGYFGFINYLGDAGDAQRGADALVEMRCLGCHDLAHRGKIGPALVVFGRSASPVGLVTDIWNHYPKMSQALKTKGLAWFAWDGDAVTDLSRYLASQAPIGTPAPLLTPGDPEQGARIFTQLGCGGCHSQARGAVAWAAFVRASNRRSAAENGAALLRHAPGLASGAAGASRPLRPVSEKEMADLLAYLSLAGAELSGGDAMSGRSVFERKRCADCHALPGAKPGIGPDVADMPAVHDPYEAAALMLQHARNMKIATELKHIPWPQMQPDELQDLYAFLSAEHRR
jgi:cytochrome c2